MSRLRSLTALLAVVALVVGACSSGASTGTPGEAAAQQEVTSAPTEVPTSAAVTPKTAAAELHLIGIGDSFIGWSTVAEHYADLLAEDSAITVNVDKITNPTSNRLDYLRATHSAQALLADADVVILQPQPGPPSAPAFNLYLADDCGGDDGQDCFRSAKADFDLYIGDLFDEVIAMTPNDTTIMVTLVGAWGVAAFHPGIEQSDPDTYRLFVDHVIALQHIAAAAAAERDIPTVDVTLAFHGPDPYEPAAQEYLLPDRTHLTDEGSRLVAELLHQTRTIADS